MKTKKCPCCDKRKPASRYGKDKWKKDGLTIYCNACTKVKNEIYYSKNGGRHRAVVAARSREVRRQIRDKLNAIKLLTGCRLCDEKDPCCLDFHHLSPATKSFGLAQSSFCNMPAIAAEVQKCVVLCANCHRKVEAGKLTVDASMKCKLSETTLS